MSLLHGMIWATVLTSSGDDPNFEKKYQKGNTPYKMYRFDDPTLFLKKPVFTSQELNLPLAINQSAWIIDHYWILKNLDQLFNREAILESFQSLWDLKTETYEQGLKVSVQFGKRAWKVLPSPWIQFKIDFNQNLAAKEF